MRQVINKEVINELVKISTKAMSEVAFVSMMSTVYSPNILIYIPACSFANEPSADDIQP
jgi:hypothetical protein